MNFIIQKLKSNFLQKIYKLSKTNIFFSRLEGTRGENTQIFRTLEAIKELPMPKALCAVYCCDQSRVRCPPSFNRVVA